MKTPNRINYDKKMQEVISSLDDKKSLLLHACCAPCASYPVEELEDQFDLTLFFYNPNIKSEEEFDKRLNELKRYSSDHKAKVIKKDYNHNEFLNEVKGLEAIPEGGARCLKCFKLRLMETAKKAKEEGFDYFTTTLTLSPLKNSQNINRIGQEVAQETGTQFLPSDFKKRNGYKRSLELSKEYNLYRQNYCGCEFSLRKEE